MSPRRFANKRFDSEYGLIFFGRRYYSPDVVATDPKISWVQAPQKTQFPRFVAEGFRRDLDCEVNIRVIIEPGGKGIVTGYPVNN